MPTKTLRDQLVDKADKEYRVTRQIATGNGDLYCAQDGPLPGFVHFELGYGKGEGPSLEGTLAGKNTAEALRLFDVTAQGLSPQANQVRLRPVAAPKVIAQESGASRRRRLREEKRSAKRRKRENKYERYAAILEIERAAMGR